MDEPDAQEELLQQYFDGELAPTLAAQVEAQLERDPAYAAQYRSLRRLREMISMSAEEIARDVDFDALYGRIETGVESADGQTGLLGRLVVWWHELLEHRPLTLAAAGAFAGLVAIAVTRLAVTDAPSPRADRAAGEARVGAGPAEHPGAAGAAAAKDETARYAKPRKSKVALAQNSEVVQVDFGDNTGTVFEIALADGVSTPVVWINDEE